MYALKEIYFTLQGEGYHSGRAAVFCRFSGCNLWSGREEDREGAICRFCDTNFHGLDGPNGGRYTAMSLARKCADLWPGNPKERFVVCTGGEPALQLDVAAIDALHKKQFEIAIETNGTLILPEGIDWICMSPKADTKIVAKKGNELKFIYPQRNIHPREFENLDFEHFYIQPMDGPELKENTRLSIDFCQQNPRWKLSLQSHKFIGIP